MVIVYGVISEEIGTLGIECGTIHCGKTQLRIRMITHQVV